MSRFEILSDYIPHLELLRFGGEVELPRTFESFFDLFIGSVGWQGPTPHSEGWFRWLGESREGSIFLLLDRTVPLRMDFRTMYTSEHTLKSTRIFLDGQEMPFQIENHDGLLHIVMIAPARTTPESDVTELFFSVSYVTREETANRPSIAVERINIFPLNEEESGKAQQISVSRRLQEELVSLSDLVVISGHEKAPAQVTVGPETVIATRPEDRDVAFEIEFREVVFGSASGSVILYVEYFDAHQISFRISKPDVLGPISHIFQPFAVNNVGRSVDQFHAERQDELAPWVLRGYFGKSSLKTRVVEVLFARLLEEAAVARSTEERVYVGEDARRKWKNFSARIPSRVHLDMASHDPSPWCAGLIGFTAPEGPDSGPVRWTVGEQAQIRFYLPISGPIKLKLKLKAMCQNLVGTTLSVMFGEDIQQAVLEHSDAQSIELTFAGHQSYSHFEISTAIPLSPQELGIGDDSRQLGLAIVSIVVERNPIIFVVN